MPNKTLVDFFTPSKTLEAEKKKSWSSPLQGLHKKGESSASQITIPRDLPPSFLVSATYNGEKRTVCIKLYEPKSKNMYCWCDTTGHKPYCFTNISPNELERIGRLMSHQGFDHVETLEKYNALLDKKVTLTKIVAKDPLAIGGRPTNSIRDIIPQEYAKISGKEEAEVWEAAIKYYQCYIYDQGLAPGLTYRIEKGKLEPVKNDLAEETVSKILNLFRNEHKEFLPYVEKWARLLEYPAPQFRRIALDIEVFSPISTRVPNPREAAYPVIAASLVGSDGTRRTLLLKRDDVNEGIETPTPNMSVDYYDSEKELILEIFETFQNYPFVLTFNGDDFDLRYLWHRAQNLGINRDQIPIEVRKRVCLLKYGIHIDLYKFFFNRSVQIYAFGKKYRDVNLNDVSGALIGLWKIELTKPFSELSYGELANYCFRDSEITFKLTTFGDDLVMKLILALARISCMPMEDVSRQGVSRWIRNFLHYEHRRRNMLIPNMKDILAIKGSTATKAIIKGKKYKGAIVVEPVPGVHFNVAVMDFPSLYPSIIKISNLGYQTILCPHKECVENKVPGTPHWICTKQKSLESLLIGSLRDLRVMWYKPKSKDKTLSKELRSWYHVIQSALKVILNASYGVFGAETFDLYCPPVAEATAAIGRHAITQTINMARELKITTIYGDTDSLFLRNPSQDQITALSKWSEKKLEMEIDVDKVYRYVVLSSRKKNYLGVFADGSVDVKGLTGKKRHIPVFIKKSFIKMEDELGRVKSILEFDSAKREIKKIIRNCYLALKKRDVQLKELSFNVVLGAIPEHYIKTTPQHVKAARLLKNQGRTLKAGDIISYVKVKKEPYVKPVELASKSEVDIDKYVEYLRSTFDQVLDALGLDFDEIIGLTKLERFM